MEEKYKRISEVLPHRESAFGDVPVYSLHEQKELFGKDFVLHNYELMEGEHGEYVHMLIEAWLEDGPNGEKDFALSTGSRAIVERLKRLREEVGDGAFPLIVKFTRNKTKNGLGEWYNIE